MRGLPAARRDRPGILQAPYVAVVASVQQISVFAKRRTVRSASRAPVVASDKEDYPKQPGYPSAGQRFKADYVKGASYV